MADLTLERIAELRACHKPIAAEGGIDAAMKVIEVLPELLDAAERGLTGGWVKNGPDVEKPKDCAWCVVRYGVGIYRTGFWSDFAVWRIGKDRTPLVDEYVTHFMEIKEPTDAK